MLKKIFFIPLFYFSLTNSYILNFQNFTTKDAHSFDVGARYRIIGSDIKNTLSNELSVGLTNLIVYRPVDYKIQEKDRLLQNLDEIDVIDHTNKEPIIYRIK